MTTCGTKAQVFVDGTWSKWMPIAVAEAFEHNLKVERFLGMLRNHQQIIYLREDEAATNAALELYDAERRAADDSPTQANQAA